MWFIALGAGILASPVLASGEFIALNKHRVVPSSVDGAMMEVYSRPGAAGPQYFCAAADYAVRRLGRNTSDRVIVVRPEAPSTTKPGFRSVLFSVRPWQAEREEDPSLTLDIDRVGEEEPIVVARKRCPRRFFGLL
jgi:hypothetical protein